MIIKGLTAPQIQACVDHTPNCKAQYMTALNRRGDRHRVKLSVRSTKDGQAFYRRGRSGYKVSALCWHGFKAFLEQVFTIAPDAKVLTSMATYDGRNGFKDIHRDTYGHNAGSMIQPQDYGSMCDCGN